MFPIQKVPIEQIQYSKAQQLHESLAEALKHSY